MLLQINNDHDHDTNNTPNPNDTIIHSQNIPKHYQTPLKPNAYESQSTRSTLILHDSPNPNSNSNNIHQQNLEPNSSTFNPSLPLFDERSDVWSVGCVLAELLLGRPIFSSIRDASSLSRAFTQLFGPTPTISLLSKALTTSPGTFNPHKTTLTPFTSNPTKNNKPMLAFLNKRAPNANHELTNLLLAMLSPELHQRPTCLEALAHPCFQNFDFDNATASLSQTLTDIRFDCHEASARKRAMSKVKHRHVQAQRRDKAPLASNSLNNSSGKRRPQLKGKQSRGLAFLMPL